MEGYRWESTIKIGLPEFSLRTEASLAVMLTSMQEASAEISKIISRSPALVDTPLLMLNRTIEDRSHGL